MIVWLWMVNLIFQEVTRYRLTGKINQFQKVP
jgi:hypothetical protein